MAFSCGKTAPLGVPAVKNVVLFTFDTTRADHLACYGSPSASTPRLDALAENGVLFEDCISTAPITLPSHASILTGLYPFSHGVRNNGTHALPDEVETLAEILRKDGFQTGAVVSAMVLNSRYGLAQGFDVYDDNLTAGSIHSSFLLRETRADDTVRRALQFLEGVGDEPYFLWVHLFDPHHGYDPPEGFAERCGGNPYDGEIAYADEQMGVVLDAIQARGDQEDTLVVMTADHGESLGEHGEPTHAIFIYDATTHVPLIFSHPSLAQGKRFSPTVSSVDIVPTLCDVLGVKAPERMDGESLRSALSVNPTEPQLEGRSVYSESMFGYYNLGWSDLRGIRNQDWRFLQAPRSELYDLAQDAKELNNVWASQTEQAGVLQKELNALLAPGQKDALRTQMADMDPTEREELEALGYVSMSFDETEAERRDPKDGIQWMEKQKRAFDMASRGVEGAEELLREVIAENPGDTTSLAMLAQLLEKDGRLQDALRARQQLASTPFAGVMEILALADLERRMELPAWKDHLQMAKLLDAEDPSALLFEGNWAFADERWKAALTAYQEVAQRDPEGFKAFLGLGMAQEKLGDDVGALQSFLRAKTLDAQIPDTHFQLGRLFEKQEKWAKAAESFDACMKLDASHADVLLRLSSSLLRIQKVGRAKKVLLRAVKMDLPDPMIYLNLGSIEARAGNPLVAKTYFLQALQFAEEQGNDAIQAAAKNYLKRLAEL